MYKKNQSHTTRQHISVITSMIRELRMTKHMMTDALSAVKGRELKMANQNKNGKKNTKWSNKKGTLLVIFTMILSLVRIFIK